jgi:hypothetical protein
MKFEKSQGKRISKISISDLLKNPAAIDNAQGKKIFVKIKEEVKKENATDIKVDFNGVKLLTTAFLNEAIGKIFLDHELKDAMGKIQLVNIGTHKDIEMLRLVIANAQNQAKQTQTKSSTTHMHNKGFSK